jgi:hypothetical protein
MRTILSCAIVVGLSGFLSGCPFNPFAPGDGRDGEIKNEPTPPIAVVKGATLVPSEADLPRCTIENLNIIYYVLSTDKFFFCSVDGYVVVNVKGEPGPMGLPGPVGPMGEQGRDGSSGQDGRSALRLGAYILCENAGDPCIFIGDAYPSTYGYGDALVDSGPSNAGTFDVLAPEVGGTGRFIKLVVQTGELSSFGFDLDHGGPMGDPVVSYPVSGHIYFSGNVINQTGFYLRGGDRYVETDERVFSGPRLMLTNNDEACGAGPAGVTVGENLFGFRAPYLSRLEKSGASWFLRFTSYPDYTYSSFFEAALDRSFFYWTFDDEEFSCNGFNSNLYPVHSLSPQLPAEFSTESFRPKATLGGFSLSGDPQTGSGTICPFEGLLEPVEGRDMAFEFLLGNNQPGDPNQYGYCGDFDGDLVKDRQDNCPSEFNPGQGDGDGDGVGNLCDDDFQGDDSDLICLSPEGAQLDRCRPDYSAVFGICIAQVLGCTYSDGPMRERSMLITIKPKP